MTRMRREQVLRPAVALGALVVAAALLRVTAHVLPVGIALAAAIALVVFAPGLALARLLGADELLDAPMLLAAAVPLGVAVWAVGLMAGMVAGLPLVAVGTGVALFAALTTTRPVPPRPAGRRAVAWLAAGGAVLAFAASRLESELHGDALFHAGRVRKLADLPRLSLDDLSSVWHGSPHAGYVVPVLHAIDAAAVRICGVDPSVAYPHLAPGCALLVPLAAYALGSVAGRTAAIAAAALAAWDVLARGTLEAIQQPPEFTFVVLIPAWLALLAVTARGGWDRRLQRALLLSLLALTLVHATYALVPLATAIGVAVVVRGGWRLLAACLTLTSVIYGVIWAVALRGGEQQPAPPVLGTVFLSHGSTPVVAQAHWIIGNRPEVALGVLSVLPLMLAFRRRHLLAATLMAGALVLCSFPGVPALLTNVFGYGQVKRFGRSGLPWALTAAIVVAELAVVTGRRLAFAAAAALAAVSLAYQAGFPEGTALTIVLAALTVGAVAAGAWIGLRRLSGGGTVSPAPAWVVLLLAAALAAGSVRAAGSQLVSDMRHGPSTSEPLPRLPAAVIGYFRAHDQARPVVLAESYIGYQLAGEADVYPVALPLERARGEARNHPTARRRAVNEALAPGVAPALRHRILDRYHASYVVINRQTTPRAQPGLASDPRLQPLLESGSWAVYGVRRR